MDRNVDRKHFFEVYLQEVLEVIAMSDIVFNDIMARVDAFSCEQKKTLLVHLKQSLKGKLTEKNFGLHAERG